MNKLYSTLVILAVAIAAALPVMAQQAATTPPAAGAAPTAPRGGGRGGAAAPATLAQQGRVSPHDTINGRVGSTRSMVMIVYGRPYSKAPGTGEIRKIWGGLVPYDVVWRTGSDEATILVTEKPLDFAGTTVPAGAYSLWTLPAADGSAKLIINKQIGQWGIKGRDDKGHDIPNHDPSLDVASVDMKKDTLTAPVDEFTMAVANDSATGGGTIRMMWENTQYSAPFTVKP